MRVDARRGMRIPDDTFVPFHIKVFPLFSLESHGANVLIRMAIFRDCLLYFHCQYSLQERKTAGAYRACFGAIFLSGSSRSFR